MNNLVYNYKINLQYLSNIVSEININNIDINQLKNIDNNQSKNLDNDQLKNKISEYNKIVVEIKKGNFKFLLKKKKFINDNIKLISKINSLKKKKNTIFTTNNDDILNLVKKYNESMKKY